MGISYPAGIDRYPGLARALQNYATSARSDLQQALDGLGNDKPTMPYELSLSFEKLLETPQLVVVSADGSRYTGGATANRWWRASYGCRSSSRCSVPTSW